MFPRPITSLQISPSSLSALQRAGFETVADLGTLSADQLAEELNIPVFLCEEIISASKLPVLSESQTQTASSLLSNNVTLLSSCAPIDRILRHKYSSIGGLRCGHVLELSGPPGSPKESAMLGFVKSTVRSGNDVIFVDAQNMTLPFSLKNEFRDSPESIDAVHYIKCLTLPDLMIFLYNLSSFLDQYPKTTLLVLNTLSFLFHSTPLTNSARSSLLERIKNILSQYCALKQLSVIITVQLATKLLSMDGSSAKSDNAVKAIMVPQLGETYLPSGRSYRLMFVPDSPNTGSIRLLSSPSMSAEDLKKGLVQEPYEVIRGQLQSRDKSSLPSS